MSARLFLLSPANCGGSRAQQLLAARGTLPLASRLQSPEGAPLGELFAYVSSLYFRGKLAYATRFAQPPLVGDPIVGSGVHIITASSGLRPPEHRLGAADLKRLARVDIRADNRQFAEPLRRSARGLLERVGSSTEVVLLGSVATPKYVDGLLEVFGQQLRFPIAFVGRGDMSRGGLLLRSAASGEELDYVPVEGAVRHGPRPPKLTPLGPCPFGDRPTQGGATRGTQ